MSDPALRELERRFVSTGAPADEVLLLRARLRAGVITSPRLRLAALLGHAPAAEALGADAPEPRSPAQLAWVDEEGLDAPTLVRAALSVSRALEPLWRGLDAERLGEALAEGAREAQAQGGWYEGRDPLPLLGRAPWYPAEAWLRCPCPEHAELAWNAFRTLMRVRDRLARVVRHVHGLANNAHATCHVAAAEAERQDTPEAQGLAFLLALGREDEPGDDQAPGDDAARREAEVRSWRLEWLRSGLEQALGAWEDAGDEDGPVKLERALRSELLPWLLQHADPLPRGDLAPPLVPPALVRVRPPLPADVPVAIEVSCRFAVALQDGERSRDPDLVGAFHGHRLDSEPLSRFADPQLGLRGGELSFAHAPGWDQLRGVFRFLAPAPLGPADVEAVLRFVSGQLSDGIGESLWIPIPEDPAGREAQLWAVCEPELEQRSDPTIDPGVFASPGG